MFALCLLIKKIAYIDPKVTYSDLKVTYSDPKVTYSEPKVTHTNPTQLPLPPPASPGHSMTISSVKLNLRVVVGGWWVTTKFNVSSRQGFKL